MSARIVIENAQQFASEADSLCSISKVDTNIAIINSQKS